MGLPTGELTLMFTDIEGSTRLLDRLGDRYGEALAEHHRIVRGVVAGHGGHEVDTQGDAFFVVFSQARAALAAAAAIQRSLAEHPWPHGTAVRVRMGLHCGHPTLAENGYFGMVVHEAARICAVAHGGQVLVSQPTLAPLDDDGLDEIAMLDLGEHALKDIAAPMRLWQLSIPGLPDDFPALRSGRAAGNLPRPDTPLIGRDREVAVVVAMLRDERARLVTLTGPGGTGKTRLAIEVATTTQPQIPGGAFFVGLAALRDAAVLTSAVSAALQLSEDAHEETLIERLRGAGVLLVLDNLEHLEGAAQRIAALLQAVPDLRILATSRAPLRLRAEREVRVSPLAVRADDGPAPAVELFVERARAVRHDFAPSGPAGAAVAEICARLDGLPLAIELAAARIRVLSPEAMLRRLEHHRLALLDRGLPDLPERHRTLAATIAWSYELLSEPERRALARLAVFPGGCSLEGAEAVCGELGADVLGLLESLVEKSLIVAPSMSAEDEPRFTILQTIREFALARLEESGETQATRRRTAEYHVELARTALWKLHGPGQAAWAARLASELDNLRAAMTWASSAGRSDVALALAASLWYFLEMRGDFTQARAWLRDALDASPGLSSDRVLALSGVCILASMQGEVEAASAEAAELEAVLAQITDPLVRARGLMALGLVATTRGDHEATRERFSAAAALARGLNDHLVAISLNNLGDSFMRQGRLDDALRALQQALDVSQRAQNPDAVSLVLVNLGIVHLARGDRDAAARRFTDALDSAALDNRLALARVVQGLGWCAARSGRGERAARLLGCADAAWEQFAVHETGLEAQLDAQVDRELSALLGPERLAALRDEGSTLSLRDGVAYALDRPIRAVIAAPDPQSEG